MGMPLKYEDLEFPAIDEVSLAEVIQQFKIPRRTLLRYASRFREFIPSSVRRPPLDVQRKHGRHRILYFEATGVDNLPLIRDLSRKHLPYDEIKRVMRESKGQIIAKRVERKIAPFIEVLKARSNSLPELNELPEDFNYAPLIESVSVLENEFDVWFPVGVKQVGEDKFEKILFLINALFLFHFREKLRGGKLQGRMRDYLSDAQTTTAGEKKLREWLGEVVGLTGRWKKKDRFAIDQLTYEFVERGGMSFILVKELFEMCARRIEISYLRSVPEIKRSWLLLLDVVQARRKLVVNSGVTDSVINVIVSDWNQRWKNGKGI